MNVVIWTRVSSREQREGYSIDAQLRATRDRAMKNGWTVVREFAVAESAKRGAERLAFNEMFKWVKSNAKKERIEGILSHKLDRVCRNMRDAVRLQELDDACGIKLLFVDNQFGPGAAGLLSFNVMAAVAQYYSDNLRTEVLKGMDERVKQGWTAGHAPFGYLNTQDKKEPIIPHPEKSATLVRIFELFYTEKYTTGSLSDKLREEGHFYSKTTPRFNLTTLSYILNNRFYIGELTRNGKVYQGRYKRLIETYVFERCQDLLKGRNRRLSKPDFLFSGGMIKCAFCGSVMTGEKIIRQTKTGEKKAYIYYKCANNFKKPDHPNVRWREDAMIKAFEKELASMRIESDAIRSWLRRTIEEAFSDTTHAQTQLKNTLKKRYSELKNMEDKLLNAYLSGMIDEVAYQSKTVALKRDIEDCDKQIADLAVIDPKRGELALAVFDFCQDLKKLWDSSNIATKREIIECLCSKREVTDTSLYLTKRCVFDFFEKTAKNGDGRGDWI